MSVCRRRSLWQGGIPRLKCRILGEAGGIRLYAELF